MKQKIFECGCTADANFDINKIPPDCPKVWELMGEGKTKGVFQLDSRLGRDWAKEVKPENIEHLAALGAILRPGVLNSTLKGKSLTKHYSDRKNNKEEVTPYHPIVDECLKDTYGILVYQEQQMLLAQKLANFNLQEADELRRGVAKKLPEIVAKSKKLFLEKAKEAGLIGEEQAEEIFSWIEKSARYSFNKSHSVGYAFPGYQSAWLKAHFPLQFFKSWAKFAHDKQDSKLEIRELVQDAKRFGIEIKCPSILDLQENFYVKDDAVCFGLVDVKGVGNAVLKKLVAQFSKRVPISWIDFLVNFSPKIGKTAVVALINSGAFDWTNYGRSKSEYEYLKFIELTDREVKKLVEIQPKTLIEGLSTLIETGYSNKTRTVKLKTYVDLLTDPPFNLDDNPNIIAAHEERLLGINLTYSKTDGCTDLHSNATCLEFKEGKTGKMALAVAVDEVRIWKVKKPGKNQGREMAKLVVSDKTGCVECVCFPDAWELNQNYLVQNNTVIISGERSNTGDDFIVKETLQL